MARSLLRLLDFGHGADAFDGHADQLDRVDRLIAANRSLVDPGNYIQAFHHLAEDRVFSIPARDRSSRDEELAGSRIRRAGVGNRQLARLRKHKPRQHLVANGETAIERRGGAGASTRYRLPW